MDSYKNTKPAIAQGWLRALLFVIFYFLITLSSGTLLMMLMPAAETRQAEPDARLVPLGFLVLAVVSMIVVWAFRKMIDRKSFASLGFEWTGNARHAGTGFALSVLLLCAGSLILFFMNHLQWTDIHFSGTDLFIGLGLMLIVAVYEETVFRGYILNNLLDSVNKWYALVFSAVLFALAHAANPNIAVLPVVNIFLAGLLLGINYIYTKNLWFGILFHFGWNFFQGPVLGYQVSGVNLGSVLEQDLKGDTFFTGGQFGFEGSVVASALYLLSVGLLVFLYNRHFDSHRKAMRAEKSPAIT
ncbi:MAG: CPBP family intramembrane metalloprotease [Gemmatimonadaceae bacterium]|nr:CPBP family intramembrane metalloprotease [Chitinophagaceae bacterium]